MNEARDKARFKELLHELTEAMKVHASPRQLEFIGRVPGDPLEHTTRRFIINDMLTGLGWDLSRMTREVVEEARVQGKAILRMDYLGVEPDTSAPLLVVEAKAWARPFIAPSSTAESGKGRKNDELRPDALIAKAIEHHKKHQTIENSPVTREWAESIEQLYDYIVAIHRPGGHRVPCVAITSGRWLVIFLNPYDTFVAAGDVSTRSLKLFDEGELVERSDEIFDCLVQCYLVGVLPDFIQPAQLPGYVRQGHAKRAFHALWIARKDDGAHFQQCPQLSLYPAVIVERSDNKLIVVLDPLRIRLPVPHEYDGLQAHLETVRDAAARLLNTVSRELGVSLTPSPIREFPGFPKPAKFGTSELDDVSLPSLCSVPKPYEFVLATGSDSHFFLARPRIGECAGHSWSDCQSLGENQDASAITSRSFDPASFFVTLEPHHCAHRQVHQRREIRCHIQPFEQFLCCSACTFQSLCWSENEVVRLPCGVRALRNGTSEPPVPQPTGSY